MTLQASGAISLTDVINELRISNSGRSATISLGDSDVLALAGKGGAPISLSDLYGRSSYVAMSGSIPETDINGAANNSVTYTATGTATVSVQHGLAPFSYVWSHVSGTGSVTNSGSSSATVSMPVPRMSSAGNTASQVVQCVVTDGKGNTMTVQGNVILSIN